MKRITDNYYGEVLSLNDRPMWSVTHNVTGRGRGGLCNTYDEAEQEMLRFVEADERASFFLVIEGTEGVGKSTLADSLERELEGLNRVLRTEEPKSHFVAYEFIKRYLSGEMQASSFTMAMAYALNRTDHLNTVVRPFLAEGNTIVICDRYMMSSLVYQARDGAEFLDVIALNREAATPDLTLLLNADPTALIDRVRLRANGKEIFDDQVEELSFKYRRCAEWLMTRGHIIAEIDANSPAHYVLRDALFHIGRHAPLWVAVP